MSSVHLTGNDQIRWPRLMSIPAGLFKMGSTDSDASSFEHPVHSVHTDAFKMDATPITNELFAHFVEATCYVTTAERNLATEQDLSIKTWRNFALAEKEQHPVLSVSWYDAVAFCKWRTATTGSLFRLPTEAEWEKAARGGLEQKLFPWGDEIPHTGERACWHRWMYEIGTLPVGSFAPNGYGLYDMAGNVWEWCSDWYADDYYASISESISESASEEVQKNPAGPETGTFKVRRGAGWNIGEPFRMRCANRGAMPAEQYWPNLGFRCVSPGS